MEAALRAGGAEGARGHVLERTREVGVGRAEASCRWRRGACTWRPEQVLRLRDDGASCSEEALRRVGAALRVGGAEGARGHVLERTRAVACKWRCVVPGLGTCQQEYRFWDLGGWANEKE